MPTLSRVFATRRADLAGRLLGSRTVRARPRPLAFRLGVLRDDWDLFEETPSMGNPTRARAG